MLPQTQRTDSLLFFPLLRAQPVSCHTHWEFHNSSNLSSKKKNSWHKIYHSPNHNPNYIFNAWSINLRMWTIIAGLSQKDLKSFFFFFPKIENNGGCGSCDWPGERRQPKWLSSSFQMIHKGSNIKITYQQTFRSPVRAQLCNFKSLFCQIDDVKQKRETVQLCSAVSHPQLPENTKPVLSVTQCLAHSKHLKDAWSDGWTREGRWGALASQQVRRIIDGLASVDCQQQADQQPESS